MVSLLSSLEDFLAQKYKWPMGSTREEQAELLQVRTGIKIEELFSFGSSKNKELQKVQEFQQWRFFPKFSIWELLWAQQ